MNARRILGLVAIGALVAGALSVPASGIGGGIVTNLVPTVQSFSSSASQFNLNTAGVLSGTVKDRNKEADIKTIQVAVTGGTAAVTFSASHDIVAGDISATTEPANFDGSGWKVWNTGGADGILSYKFQYTYTTLGSYIWTPSVKDQDTGAVFQSGATATVTALAPVTYGADPVDSSAAVLAGARLGAWSAAPAATSVGSTNYLIVTNTGVTATQSFTVSFSAATFTGTTVTGETININNNIQFGYWEDTTPSTSAPSEGTFTWKTTSASGADTFTFTGTGNVMYVTYRLVALPDPLVDQPYEASYTVGAV
jgi:hypothetical protein